MFIMCLKVKEGLRKYFVKVVKEIEKEKFEGKDQKTHYLKVVIGQKMQDLNDSIIQITQYLVEAIDLTQKMLEAIFQTIQYFIEVVELIQKMLEAIVQITLNLKLFVDLNQRMLVVIIQTTHYLLDSINQTQIILVLSF